MAAYQSGEPDRYRAIRLRHALHENDLTTTSTSRTREVRADARHAPGKGVTSTLRDMAVAPRTPGDGPEPRPAPYNPRTDTARTQEFPRALHAIMEHHAKLTSSFKTRARSRPSPSANRAKPDASLTRARRRRSPWPGATSSPRWGCSRTSSATSQPLHTTRCFNGWSALTRTATRPTRASRVHRRARARTVQPELRDNQGRREVRATRRRHERLAERHRVRRKSHARVEPLYVLEKLATSSPEPGKAFIRDCLLDGGSMLAALYAGRVAGVDDRRPRGRELPEVRRHARRARLRVVRRVRRRSRRDRAEPRT